MDRYTRIRSLAILADVASVVPATPISISLVGDHCELLVDDDAPPQAVTAALGAQPIVDDWVDGDGDLHRWLVWPLSASCAVRMPETRP